MGHFIKWGNVINQKKKCLPSLMFIFLYLIVPWCINGLGGVKSADSQIGIKRWKRRELQALIPEGPAGDKTGEGWDLLRPRPPEGVAARE